MSVGLLGDIFVMAFAILYEIFEIYDLTYFRMKLLSFYDFIIIVLKR